MPTPGDLGQTDDGALDGAGDLTDVTDVTAQSEAEHLAHYDDPERATPEQEARTERLWRDYGDSR